MRQPSLLRCSVDERLAAAARSHAQPGITGRVGQRSPRGEPREAACRPRRLGGILGREHILWLCRRLARSCFSPSSTAESRPGGHRQNIFGQSFRRPESRVAPPRYWLDVHDRLSRAPSSRAEGGCRRCAHERLPGGLRGQLRCPNAVSVRVGRVESGPGPPPGKPTSRPGQQGRGEVSAMGGSGHRRSGTRLGPERLLPRAGTDVIPGTGVRRPDVVGGSFGGEVRAERPGEEQMALCCAHDCTLAGAAPGLPAQCLGSRPDS
jgi:hypothetical protein